VDIRQACLVTVDEAEHRLADAVEAVQVAQPGAQSLDVIGQLSIRASSST
jgi:hypothetical protein